MRFAFACAVFGVAQLTFLATLGSVAGTCPSRSESVCDHELPGVGLSRPMVNQPPEFTDNTDKVNFYPELPGIFTLRYRAENLCYFDEKEINVEVKCPPPPTVSVTSSLSSDNRALQNEQVSFTATVKTVSIPENEFSYSWALYRVDGRSGGRLGEPVHTRGSLAAGAGGATYTSTPLKIQGQYEAEVTVYDGCSSKKERFCFEVVCNCGPTANARATHTVWTNNIDAGDNAEVASDGTRLQFKLDGSLSDDFDLAYSTAEQLTYDWSILEWIPNQDQQLGAYGPVLIPAKRNGFDLNKWSMSEQCNSQTQAENNQYLSRCTSTPAANGGYVKDYTFQHLPPATGGGRTDCSTELGSGREPTCDGYRAKDATQTRADSVEAGFLLPPDSMATVNSGKGVENFMLSGWDGAGSVYTPAYPANPTSTNPGNVDPSTTSCMAYLQERIDRTDENQLHYNVTTHVLSTSDPYSICRMKITQQSPNDPVASLEVYNPNYSAATADSTLTYKYYGEHGAFEVCRGLWKFQLLVKDQCSESRDQIILTVRCNRPPVAATCCDTTVQFMRAPVPGFPQVTVDGRLSGDLDNPSTTGLTYFWSFVSTPSDYALPFGVTCNNPAPCEQEYCQRVRNSPSQYKTCVYGSRTSTLFGNAVKQGSPCPTGNNQLGVPTIRYSGVRSSTSDDDKNCGLHVYPIVYDCSRIPCTIASSIDNTRYHRGNSAYFKPTVAGTYQVKLQVFDGCSMSEDTVNIRAICPDLSATISVNGVMDPQAATAVKFSPRGAASGQVKLDAEVAYSDNSDFLKYTWSFYKVSSCSKTKSECCAAASVAEQINENFSPRTTKTTTFTPRIADGSGTYVFCLVIEDGADQSRRCQRKVFASADLEISCNNAPVAKIAPDATTPVQADEQGLFPTQTLTVSPEGGGREASKPCPLAASTCDPEGDDISWKWSVGYCKSGNSCSDNSYTAYPEMANAAGSARNGPLSLSVRLGANEFEGSQTRGAVKFRATASVTDQCSTTVINKVIDYNCKPMPSPQLTFLGGSRNNGRDVLFQHASNSGPTFEELTIAGTEKAQFPYPTLTTYKWCVKSGRVDRSQCTDADTPPLCRLSSNECKYTPKVEGSYTVSLTVSDECTTEQRQDFFSAVCTAAQRPTAELTLSAAGQSPLAGTMYWNSFNSRYLGAFDDVTATACSADKCKATEGQTNSLFYFFYTSAPGSGAASVLNGNLQPTRTVKVSGPGSWSVRLEVVNGASPDNGCRSQPTTQGFNAVCLTITPVMSLTSSSGGMGTSVIQSGFNGLSFEDVRLHGANTPNFYGRIDGRGNSFVAGNLHSLFYTWSIKSSPRESMYKQQTDSAPSRVRGTNSQVTTLDPIKNATHRVEVTSYVRTFSTTKLTTSTTLFNHHYNMPITGFRPDVRGTYTIGLTVRDGCTSAQASATVVAQCTPANILSGPPIAMAYNTATMVNGTSADCINCNPAKQMFGIAPNTNGNTITIFGNTFRRVTADARSRISLTSFGGRGGVDGCSSLTYSWSLTGPNQTEYAPFLSGTDARGNPQGNAAKIVDLTDDLLSNSRGNIASFVPSRHGQYTLTFKACRNTPEHSASETPMSVKHDINKCQLCQTQTLSITVICQNNMPLGALKPPAVRNQDNGAFIHYIKKADAARDSFIDPKYKQRPYFELTGSLPTNPPAYPTTCNVLKRKWVLWDRKCSTPYSQKATPAPTGKALNCPVKYECTWKVKAFPCGWDTTGIPADGWVNQCAGEGCVIKPKEGQPKCTANFKCKRPGTYTLELHVEDGCSATTKETTVVCKCKNKLNLKMPPEPRVFKTCDAESTTRKFAAIQLMGDIDPVPNERTGAPLPACAAKPLPTPATPKALANTCCPALSPCPACPQCPDCAVCPPGYIQSFPGEAPLELAEDVIPGAIPQAIPIGAQDASERAVPAMAENVLEEEEEEEEEDASAFVSSDEEEDEVSTSLLLGVILPICVIIVSSMIGNVLLFNKLRSVGARHQLPA